MLGLVLEGGGARGAYHIGVAKAYFEHGYEFDGFVGTSIGAINAAAFVQGDFENTLNLWQNLITEQLFDADEQTLIKIGQSKWDINILTNAKNSLKKVIEQGGLDTSKIRAFLGKYIDEQKIRSSSKDFGLVTVSVTEKKPYELFLEDIAQGELLQYIMASACFPGFKFEVIGEKSFIDGALYNNCPINMLIEKGYDEIVVVRTMAFGIFRKVAANNAKIKIIAPTEDLGNIMLFSKERIAANIELGYYDGLRSIRNLRGQSYYFDTVDAYIIEKQLMSLNDEIIYEASDTLGFPRLPAKRILFERIIPKFSSHLKLKKDFDYVDFFIALLEYVAKDKKIERFQIYNYKEFLNILKEKTSEPEILKDENSILSKLSNVNFAHRYEIAINLILKGILEAYY